MTTPDPDFLPFDRDAARPEDLTRKRRDPRKAPPQAPMPAAAAAPRAWPDLDPIAAPFLYIGQALTPAEFRQYCLDYDFGSVPPSWWIWHHTYNPDASWAPIGSNQGTWWDRNEAGLSVDQKKAKRKPQLDGIMRYYRDSLGWTVGPHLFVDDLFIWLFTPMYDVGIHANEGNSYHDSAGKLHYSIGCEVIGDFDPRAWPASIQAVAGWACACVKQRLGFDLRYVEAPEDRPDLHDLSLSGHRDYSDKTCPGNGISNSFFVQVAQAGWAAYQANTPPGPKPPPDPLRARTIPGPERSYYCSVETADYYAARGGFAVLGWARGDEFKTTDRGGDTVTVFYTDRGAVKGSGAARELALLSETCEKGWFVP
jgi:hypothetical protein